MAEFRVWSPGARGMELSLGGRLLPMTAGVGGWWTLTVPGSDPEAEYGFMMNGNGPFPDPRSPRQPAGVHGMSKLVDHGAFPWSDDLWQAPPLSSGVIYELHIGTFTPGGTFDSAIERLDDLKDLGVTHVEVMPVNSFPGGRGWGYDGVSLFAPQESYGGPLGLKRFVDACHARGLAALIDVVYNHLGPSGNYLGTYGPYFTKRYVTPWGQALNFDAAYSHEVRRFFCDNARMWLRDYHFDGLRVDAVHAILDTSALHFLEQLVREVRELEVEIGRHLVVIAESDLNDPRMIRSAELGGYGFDAQWSDDFHHALHTVLTGERDGYYADFGSIGQLARALRRGFVYEGDYSEHRGRPHGRTLDGVNGHRLLAYAQNHDQVGNRARGERLSQLVRPERLKIAAAFVLLSPFVPMLFQGEEWGASSPFVYFTDHPEDELGRAVSEGRRKEFEAFGWKADDVPDPQSEESFQVSKLDWSERERSPHRDVLDWHRELIRLRKTFPELLDGRMDRVETLHDDAAQWLTFRRGRVALAVNFARDKQRVPLENAARARVLMSSGSHSELTAESIVLGTDSVAILDVLGGGSRP